MNETEIILSVLSLITYIIAIVYILFKNWMLATLFLAIALWLIINLENF